MSVLDKMCRAYIDSGGTRDWQRHPEHIKRQVRDKMRAALRVLRTEIRVNETHYSNLVNEALTKEE